MDARRERAKKIFDEEQRFADPGASKGYHELVWIDYGKIAKQDGSSHVQKILNKSQPGLPLTSRVREMEHWSMNRMVSINRKNSPIGLKLLLIQQSQSWALNIEPSILRSIWSGFGLDPYIKYLLCRNADGFYAFEHHDLPENAGPSPTSRINSYFINVRGYFMLAWSFDPNHFLTSAILISRASQLPEIEEIIDAYQEFSEHPLALCLASAALLTETCDLEIWPELSTILDIELRTGYSPWIIDDSDSTPSLHEGDINPIVLSGRLSATQVVLSIYLNRLTSAKALLESLQHRTQPLCRECHSTKFKVPCKTTGAVWSANLLQAVELLKTSVSTNEIFVTSLQKRADVQQMVLFNLITKEDTNATIAIAEATKDDGKSMKTVAILTMAFLPGTFFAALFSMPSLHWDENPVAQANFWIYWMFTLPFTAIVFGVWHLSTRSRASKPMPDSKNKAVSTESPEALAMKDFPRTRRLSQCFMKNRPRGSLAQPDGDLMRHLSAGPYVSRGIPTHESTRPVGWAAPWGYSNPPEPPRPLLQFSRLVKRAQPIRQERAQLFNEHVPRV